VNYVIFCGSFAILIGFWVITTRNNKPKG